ncbi:hypothetical protein RJT34_19349 [Clitoria ternatea]|uniref:Uncharacterized protein n=1 Tax=Clitoria ternatea TaxID=43366 RepID=A0AAN9P3K2_CLITE
MKAPVHENHAKTRVQPWLNRYSEKVEGRCLSCQPLPLPHPLAAAATATVKGDVTRVISSTLSALPVVQRKSPVNTSPLHKYC